MIKLYELWIWNLAVGKTEVFFKLKKNHCQNRLRTILLNVRSSIQGRQENREKNLVTKSLSQITKAVPAIFLSAVQLSSN